MKKRGRREARGEKEMGFLQAASNAGTKIPRYGCFVFRLAVVGWFFGLGFLLCPLGTHSKEEHSACVTSSLDNRPS